MTEALPRTDDLSIVLSIGGLPCGDVLKAQLINQLTSLSIDFSRMPLPKGEAEALFAKLNVPPKPKAQQLSARIPEPEPVLTPPDTTRLSGVPEMRFEDIDPAEEARKAKAVEKPAAPVEPEQEDAPVYPKADHEVTIDGKVYVDLAGAVVLLGVSAQGVYQRASTEEWRRTRSPLKRGVLYLKDDVLSKAGGRSHG